tara:strand:- start:1315 stop:2313 length:999 start_codon:yes stop_codon:yes gene_type:complete
MVEKIKKKRGRKPKKKVDPVDKPPPKKRGRKPKGGKIIKKAKPKNKTINMKENIILHLKCKTSDLTNNKMNISDYCPNLENPEAYTIHSNIKSSQLTYQELYDVSTENNQNVKLNVNHNFTSNLDSNENPKQNKQSESSKNDMKKIWNKLEKLKVNLRSNTASDKKSACFWCTYEFDNPAIFIPKQYNMNLLEVYGCFCSPECAVAYLKSEDIDNSRKWERYTLLNNIYSKIFDYEKNIKPAPNPFYTLDKYYGNLTIDEYRKLLQNERILMVVDKPMTKVLPELYEENNEIPFINNNLLDNTHNNTSDKFRLKRTTQKPSKKVSIVDSFNL